MVNHSSMELDRKFGALADSTRRAILARLAAGKATVSELVEPFEISLPAVSKHVRALEEAGLLTSRREGRTRVCRLAIEGLTSAVDWIESQRRFWTLSLDNLERYLQTEGDQRGGNR